MRKWEKDNILRQTNEIIRGGLSTELRFYFDGTNGIPVEGEVPLNVMISKQNADSERLVGELKFRYSDTYFLRSACSYNHALAIMSLGMTMSAFTCGEEGDGCMRTALRAIGCDERTMESKKYGPTVDFADTCGYMTAAKRLPDGSYLVPIIIRSHRYGGEWVSNCHAVDDAYPDHAAGFKEAADGVYDGVLAYLARRGFDRSRVRLWVCGYSRGGAVANLLGARLTFSSGIEKDRIFVYTFATPTTVFDRAARYTDNIFNIISELDTVPRLPLRRWNLTRYGEDMSLPCKARRGEADYSRLLGQMQRRFNEIMAQLGVNASYMPLDDQEMALDLLFDSFYELLDTPEKYRDEGYQELAMDYMKSRIRGDEFEPRSFLRFLLDGNVEMADNLCAIIDSWHELGGLEKMQRLAAMIAKRHMGEKSPATEIVFLVVGILFRYAGRHAATKVTGGDQDYLYEQLTTLLVDCYERGGESFILQQHWPEAYLAWLSAAPPDDLFRVGSYPRKLMD